MMTKHNKKRNVGLLYEFLVRHIAESLVQGDDKQAKAGMKLLRKHILKKNTELYREFRLFNALVNTTVTSESVAGRIIDEARAAAKSYDADKLDKEKSLLIRSINHTFKDEHFYDKRFDEYRMYATIQTVLNEWRKPAPEDIGKLAQYENTITEWLLSEKQHNILEETNDDVDDLVVNLMVKKVNKRYNNVLSNDQIGLIKQYVYSMKSGNDAPIRETLENLRKETLEAVDVYMNDHKTEQFVVQKLSEVRSLITEDLEKIDDDVLTRFLRIAKLKAEIMGG